MKGALWSVVLAIAIVLRVAADIPIQPDFDFSKTQGKWHAIACAVIKGKPKSPEGYQVTVEPQENGDLHLSKLVSKGGTCTKKKVRLLHTDQPGKFTTQKGSTVYAIETDYDSYCVQYIESSGSTKAMHLFTRAEEASDELKEKFKTLAKSLEFTEDKIKFLTKPDPCPAPRDAET